MRLTEMVSTHDARIRWGILSTGHIASVLTRDLALLPDEAEVVAVGSRSLDKAEQFAREYQIPRAYGSYAELAADPEVDVIYVASTHNDHLGSARLCLEAGKAVLVEKPLTVSAAETEELVDLAGERGVFLMEALWSRTNPLLRQAAQLVRVGRARRHPARHRLVRLRLRRRPVAIGCSTPIRPAERSSTSASTRSTPSTCSSASPIELYGFGTLASTGVEVARGRPAHLRLDRVPARRPPPASPAPWRPTFPPGSRCSAPTARSGSTTSCCRPR